MSEMKEVKELMEGLKHLAVFVARVARDGKVDLTDMVHVMQLLNNQAVLMGAIQGITDVPKELKGIDLDQAGRLMIELITAIKDVKAEAA